MITFKTILDEDTLKASVNLIIREDKLLLN